MLYIPHRNLDQNLSDYLSALQDEVDNLQTHEEQVNKAKILFDRRKSSAGKRQFQEISDTLSRMAPPYRRCYYCEDSEHRDVEHIKPKRHYPDLCFKWVNYAYACTICNGAKSDTVALFTRQDNSFEIFTRLYPKGQRLPAGDHVLIDPRTEDPLNYIKLDLLTGNLNPLIQTGRPFERARHTIDLLKLNRDAVRRNRFSMITSYIRYLEAYEASVEADDGRSKRIYGQILELPQPTVFAELKRQKDDFPELQKLINKLP